ncbi:MAG: HAMP domain-containing histidine kinase [Muribaculaceae bacterium]|nr:HAMP domain-containing histidine kinase [Muribaculaceae bacterium]
MKRLKLITALSLILTAILLGVATYNLIKLYIHEKENTMETVKECAENAVLLEMISRMETSEVVPQSYIRLNAFLEMVQQKDGRLAKADSIRTSLASLLCFGLEFKDNKSKKDMKAMDSIFRVELARHNLFPNISSIIPVGTSSPYEARLWKTQYSYNPAGKPTFDVYVSQMYGVVLSRMWGIIIPFIAVILLFLSLSAYLVKTISKMRTIEQMKDDFTHNMTHELKTPVAVAYSAVDSMLRYYDQSDEARNKQFLRIIMQRLSFLSGMIENILSMSMERFKTMKLNIERVAIKSIVEEVSGMMELKADKPVKIDVDIPDNLSVMADSLHLGNVLSNLIDNAVKYSGDSVEIKIKADGTSIEIADNGIGIEKTELPYIFDKFYRVSSGDRYEVSGYGLGLFYVKQIVEMFGWNIQVASKPRQGTKFTIRFKSNEER